MATDSPPTELLTPAQQAEAFVPNINLLNQMQNTVITSNPTKNVFLQVSAQDQFKRVQFITESVNTDGSIGNTSRFELYLTQPELNVLITKLQEHLTQ